jgi:hypothetical protein
MLARVMFMLTITWFLSMIVGTIKINNHKKCKQITCDFDHHVDVVIQFGAHCTMEHIQGFSRSHWIADSSFMGASDISRLQLYHTIILFGEPD